MSRSPLLLVVPALALLLFPPAVAAQSQQNGDRKRADAVRVPAGSIRVDGRLDESAWQTVPPLTEFVQKEPVEGARPTDRMEVRGDSRLTDGSHYVTIHPD